MNRIETMEHWLDKFDFLGKIYEEYWDCCVSCVLLNLAKEYAVYLGLGYKIVPVFKYFSFKVTISFIPIYLWILIVLSKIFGTCDLSPPSDVAHISDIITACQRSCGKVMFSVMPVYHSVHGEGGELGGPMRPLPMMHWNSLYRPP